MIDATLIVSPSLNKNLEGNHDPEMEKTKMGDQWCFVIKAHIGVDADTGMTHTLVTTPMSVDDVTQAHAFSHRDAKPVISDAGCKGAAKSAKIVGAMCAGRLRCTRANAGRCLILGLVGLPSKSNRLRRGYVPSLSIRFALSTIDWV